MNLKITTSYEIVKTFQINLCKNLNTLTSVGVDVSGNSSNTIVILFQRDLS